ncbi:MAG: hypothetical protein ACYCTL_07055 [Acidimicrobiales bacterium]
MARVVVAVALVSARIVAPHIHHGTGLASATARAHEGLLAWDAGWYESITRAGYWGAGHSSLRFFPLVPLLARVVAFLPGIGAGTGLLIVSNAAALVAGALVFELARRETGDSSLARMSTWLIALAPPAFVLVMGYSESTLLVLAVGTFLLLRTRRTSNGGGCQSSGPPPRRWWLVALLGFLAGLARPLGVLLAIPIAIEALRGSVLGIRLGIREPGGHAAGGHAAGGQAAGGQAAGGQAARLAAIASAPLGTAAYLGWVGWRYGNALAPVDIQTEARHHGGLADPVTTVARALADLVTGHHLGVGEHAIWVAVAVALLVWCLRRWPISYGAFAGAIVAVAVTGTNLASFERYALSAFPLALTAAVLLRSRRGARWVVVLSALAMGGYALLAFLGFYVP